MCGSMVDIESATAEISRGKKRKKEETGQKYNVHICYAGCHNNKHHINIANITWKTVCSLSKAVSYVADRYCCQQGLQLHVLSLSAFI